MTFFEDLSPYTYHRPEESPGTVNIGWLDRNEPFPIGQTSEVFQAILVGLCRKPMRQMRGFHRCPFCRGRHKPCGSAEIRVRTAARVYAAPALIHHYVTAHGYKPPNEFIEAVVAAEAAC